MPDYDLGTAHGKIRIDADSSGVEAVNAAVDQFKRAIDAVIAHTAAFDAAMNRMESELRQVRNDFIQASASAENYNRTLTIVHVSGQNASQSQNILARNLANIRTGLLGAAAAAAEYHGHLSQLVTFSRAFQASNGGLIGFTTSLQKAGAASTALNLLTSRFLGISRVMSTAPQWQRNMLNFANSLRLVTVAYAGFKYLPDILEKVAGSSRIASTAISGLGRVLGPVGNAIKPFASSFDNLVQSIGKLPNSIAQTVIGWNVMRGGINGLFGGVSKLVGLFKELPGWIKATIGTLVLIGPAIVESLSAALRFTSNMFAGIFTAVKDLAGGLLALPGTFAMIGAAAIPLIGIFATLKSAFGTLFKDALSGDMQKVTNDLNKLPDYLRPIGGEIASLVPKIKQLGDQFTATFTSGLAEQLDRISGTYLPAIYNGGTLVAASFKNVKDQVVAFILQSQTVADVNELFFNTSKTINSVANATQPVLRGLRDIGVVGTEFIRDLAERILPGIANGFEQWAAKARETGQMRVWMEASVRAMSELWVGTKNVLQATGQLLTLFKTGSGETFLKHYAEDMKKFNDEVHRSASSGTLRQIADSVRGVGTDNIKELVGAVKQMAPALGEAVHFIAQFAGAFGNTLIPSLELASSVLKTFLSIINAMGGGAIIGTFLGIVGASKLVALALGPISNSVRIVVGAFSLMRGVDSLVMRVGIALENLGGIGAVAAEKLVGGFTMIRTAISLTVGVITAALGAFLVYKQGAEEIERSQQAITDSAKHTKDSIEDIKQAMLDDKGIAGDNVFTAIKTSVDTAMSDLENQANAMPGIMARITDFLRGGNESSAASKAGAPSWLKPILQGIPIVGSYINMPTGSSNEVNNQSKVADQAKKTQEAFNKLTITNRDVAVAVGKGGPAWDDLINKLKTLGADGQPAIDFLNKLKDQVKQGTDAGKQAAAANGKLTASMTAAEQAAAAYGSGAHTLAEALAHIQVEADQASDAIMGSTENYNKFLKTLQEKKAAPAIIDMVKQLREQFENGGAQVKEFSDAIDKMHDSMASADEKAQAFISSLKHLGTIPDDEALSKYNEDVDNAIGYQQKLVDMLDRTGNSLVQQGGKLDLNSKNGRTLSQTMQQLIQDNVALVESGRASPEEAYAHTTDVLRRLFSQFQITDPSIQNQIIQTYFPPNAFQNAIKAQDPKGALEQLFKNDPAKLNTELNLLTQSQDIINNIVGKDGKLHVPTVLDVAPPGPPPAARPGPPAAPPGPPRPAGPTPGQPNLAPVFPGAASPVQPPQTLAGDLASNPAKLMPLLATNPDIGNVLLPFIAKAQKQGESFSDAFADGIKNGSPEVKAAIIKLAKLAGDGLGSSPAKYGPLSGDGWSYYRGQTFTADWAGGINSGAGAVKNATKDVAYGAVTGMKDQNKDAFKQLSDMGNLVAHVVDLGKQMGSVFTDFGKAMNAVTGGQAFPKRYVPDPLKLPPSSGAAPWTPGGWTPPTGGGTGGAAPAALSGNASRQDIANYILQSALSKGYTQDQANAILTQAVGESGLKQDISGGNQGGEEVLGIFQEKGGFSGGLSPDQRRQAGPNIDAYFKQLAAHGGPAAAGQGDIRDFLGNVSGGGPAHPANRSQWAGASAAAAPLIAGFTPTTTAAASGPGVNSYPSVGGVPNAGLPGAWPSAGRGAPSSYSPDWMVQHGFAPLFTKAGGDATQAEIPPYLRALAQQFGLPISSHADSTLHGGQYGKGNTLQPSGAWAVDIGGPGSDPAQMEKLAQFLQQNYKPDIAQLIHRSPTRDYGIAGGEDVGGARGQGQYYTTGEGYNVHSDHVHVAFALPFGNALPVNVTQAGGQNVPPGALGTPGGPASPTGGPAVPGAPIGGAAALTHVPEAGGWVDGAGNVFADQGGIKPTGAKWNGPGQLQPAGTAPAATVGAPQPLTGAQPNGTPGNPLNVALPPQDSNQLGNLDQLGTVSQTLQNIGVPQNITTQSQAVTALQSIDGEITKQNNLQTPAGKQMADQLGQMHSDIQEKFGLKEAPSGIDTMSSITSGIGGIASDFIGDFQSFVEVIGATKNIGDALVRGPASTEDLIGIVQNFQKYIEFAAKIANTVGDVAGQIGGILGAVGSASGMPGAGGPGAALQGVQAIAQLISGILQTVNASISLSIEAWHIFGSYFGGFLGFLAGGSGGLMGNVKFLLDQNTGQLISYSTDNPMKKNALPVPGMVVNPTADNQTIGQLNYYAGPGQDPRDSTRQMMYQVKSSQMNTVTAQ